MQLGKSYNFAEYFWFYFLVCMILSHWRRIILCNWFMLVVSALFYYTKLAFSFPKRKKLNTFCHLNYSLHCFLQHATNSLFVSEANYSVVNTHFCCLISEHTQPWYVELHEARAQRWLGLLPLAPAGWGGLLHPWFMTQCFHVHVLLCERQSDWVYCVSWGRFSVQPVKTNVVGHATIARIYI